MDDALFEKYYERELEGEALKAFEESLRLDENFVIAYKEYAQSRQALQSLQMKATENRLKDISLPITNHEHQHKRRSIIRNTAIAASLILFICFSYLINKGSSLDYQRLADNFYEKPINPAIKSTDAAENIFTTAYTLFDSKDYSKAKEAFRNILNRDPENMDALEGLAHCQYQLEEWEEASRHFNNLYKHHKNIASKENSEWMMILIALQKKAEKSSLIEMLDPMLNESQHSYHFKAKKLIESL